jgi:quinol monooxygenase YgiN
MAAVTGSISMFLAIRFMKDPGQQEDLTPSREFKVPVGQTAPQTGHVVVTFEYRIDPTRAAAFVALMQQSRRSRLRQGALSWELLHDLGEPGRYLEQVVDESWTEHLRRFDRVTAADVALRDRKLAFHVATEPPVVTRYAIEDSERPRSSGHA